MSRRKRPENMTYGELASEISRLLRARIFRDKAAAKAARVAKRRAAKERREAQSP